MSTIANPVTTNMSESITTGGHTSIGRPGGPKARPPIHDSPGGFSNRSDISDTQMHESMSIERSGSMVPEGDTDSESIDEAEQKDQSEKEYSSRNYSRNTDYDSEDTTSPDKHNKQVSPRRKDVTFVYKSQYTARQRSYKRIETNTAYKSSKHTDVSNKKKDPKESSSICNSKLLLFFAITIIITSYCVLTSNNKSTAQVIQPTNKPVYGLENAIGNIQRKFWKQKTYVWHDILAGISAVVHNRSPLVNIVLFANESKTMDCLATLLGGISSMALGSDGCLTLTPMNVSHDTGQFIKDLKNTLQHTRVMVMHDVLNINTNGLRALHNVCDRFNPLVPRVVNIFTMVVSGYKETEKELKFIDDQLRQTLSGKLDEDIIPALTTRFTDAVIVPVQPEENMTECF